MGWTTLRWCFGVLLVAAALATGSGAQAQTVRIHLKADPPSLDPFQHIDLTASSVLDHVYEGLTTVGDDGLPVPALATRWEARDDGRTWRFHLRTDVVFHSGRPFTALDVKWTFEKLLSDVADRSIEAFGLRKVVGADDLIAGKAHDLSGVTVVDRHTLDVTLTEPDSVFPYHRFYIVDRGIAAEAGRDWPETASGGTGPFRLARWDKGIGIRLTRFDRYWAKPRTVEGLDFQIIESPEAALAAYDEGRLDVLIVPEPVIRWVWTTRRYENDRVLAPRAQMRAVGFNRALFAPFRDRRVREAVALVINQAALAEALYPHAATVTGGLVPSAVGGPRSRLPVRPYDPVRAQALLAEAGYPDGRGFPPLEIAALKAGQEEAAYVGSQLQMVLHIPAEVSILERKEYFGRLDRRSLPMVVWGWTTRSADPMYFLGLLWKSGSPFNRLDWADAEYDALLARAERQVDTTERYALYGALERLLFDDIASVALPTPDHVVLRKPWLDSIRVKPYGQIEIGRPPHD